MHQLVKGRHTNALESSDPFGDVQFHPDGGLNCQWKGIMVPNSALHVQCLAVTSS